MRILQYSTRGGGARVGVMHGERILDLLDLLNLVDGSQPLFAGIDAWTAAVQLVHRSPEVVISALRAEGDTLASPEVAAILPPFPLTGSAKVVCTGANFVDHRRETEENTNTVLPDERIFGFLKAPSALIGPAAAINLTSEVVELDFEVELAVIFGAPVDRSTSDDALMGAVAGYTIFNDLSDRALQRAEMGAGLLCAAKNRPGYGPLGPALVTMDQVGDPNLLDIASFVNDERRQHASTRDMIFSVRELVRYWSRTLTFDPGDVMTCGTPSGNAMSEPVGHRRFLRAGDIVELRIENLGSLTNPVTSG